MFTAWELIGVFVSLLAIGVGLSTIMAATSNLLLARRRARRMRGRVYDPQHSR
jgi:hypothetical protein